MKNKMDIKELIANKRTEVSKLNAKIKNLSIKTEKILDDFENLIIKKMKNKKISEFELSSNVLIKHHGYFTDTNTYKIKNMYLVEGKFMPDGIFLTAINKDSLFEHNIPFGMLSVDNKFKLFEIIFDELDKL